MTIDIFTPYTDAQWEAYFQLRWQILRAPWGQARGSETDLLDTHSFHLMAVDKGTIVGVGRLHVNSQSEAQIRYMAVTPQRRGQGIGRIILSNLEQEACRLRIQHIVLQARVEAVQFYRANGYYVLGPGPTLFGEIEHMIMKKDLLAGE